MVEVAGAVLAVKELFKYNRKAFMFDAKLRQEREFQEQDMRVEQFALYREDVRDLVELTVAKMDLYLVSTALLIDKTMMLICKQKEAFPPEENHVPEWAIALNSLSLASGSFFLLLSLWLAMYASISAQSFGTRLLTQYVRLPTASQEQIDSATAEATQFEAKGVGELVKVPFTTPQRDESAVGAAGPGDASAPAQLPPLAAAPPPSAAQPPDAGPSADDEAAWNLLPSAMLEHIRLYRKVQLNWQAYDAYARVSLFVGANSLLYACLYWSMGNFLNLTHERFRDNCFPALATALIFSAIQLTITRLDLRLPKKYMTYITLTVVLSPVVTVLGLLFHADLIGRMAKGETVQPWRRHLMDFLALMAHSIQALLMALVLRAAWPERSGTDEHQALLPGRFRSTLYLDVFGWLLNPGGPGAGARRRSRDSAAAGESWRSAGSPTGSPPADSDSDASSEHVPSEMRTPMRRSRGAASPRRELNARNRRVTFAAWRASLANVFTQDRGQRVPRDREIGLGEGLGRDLRDQFSPRSSPRTSFARGSAAGDSYRRSSLTRGREPAPSAPTSMTQELRFGGAEALPRDVMEDMDDPANPGVAADAFGLPAESVPERAPVPGEHPWQAFLLGTSVILGLWVLSTVWALGPLLGLTSGWARGPKPNATAPERLGPRTRRPLPAGAAGRPP